NFEYIYDAHSGRLHVRHGNSAFRTGIEGISINVRLEENIITVIEKQRNAAAGGLRLYDLEFVISNLPLRSYRVVVIEPYVKETERPISFRMDLVENPNGSSEVERTQAPWGEMAAF
ncbi:MAG: hypothetical protein WC824_01085, partial [Bacteroidota bacterium]